MKKNLWKPYLLGTIQILLFIRYFFKWVGYTNILTENKEFLFLIIVIQLPSSITYFVFSIYLGKNVYKKNKNNIKFLLKKIFNNNDNYTKVNSKVNKIEVTIK